MALPSLPSLPNLAERPQIKKRTYNAFDFGGFGGDPTGGYFDFTGGGSDPFSSSGGGCNPLYDSSCGGSGGPWGPQIGITLPSGGGGGGGTSPGGTSGGTGTGTATNAAWYDPRTWAGAAVAAVPWGRIAAFLLGLLLIAMGLYLIKEIRQQVNVVAKHGAELMAE